MDTSNNNPNQQPAHTLGVELSTRITLQPLHYRSGNEETAAESVHQLFKTTRELMTKNPEAAQFNELGLKLLNGILRPYTARWHLWMTETKLELNPQASPRLIFKDEQVRRLFRAELKELHGKLRHFQKAFEAISKLEQIPDEIQKALDDTEINTTSTSNLGNSIRAGGLPFDSREYEEISQRRASLALPHATEPLANLTGLALSGGGIRSATFCLGIVQTLARKNIFHHFDYISTVSGGGYLGTFLSSIFADELDDKNKAESDPNINAAAAKKMIDEVLAANNSGNESTAIRHLRNSSKYLKTGGPALMAGLIVYGILVNFLLFLPVPLFAAIATYFLYDWGFWQNRGGEPGIWLGLEPSIIGYLANWTVIAMLIMGFVLAGVQSFTQGNHQSKIRDRWEKVTLGLAILSLVFGLLYALPDIFCAYNAFSQKILHVQWQMLITGTVPLLLAYGSKLLEGWKKFHHFLLKLFVLSGPVFFTVIFLAVGNHLEVGIFDSPTDHSQEAISIASFTLVLWFWGWWLVNINTTSPHRYYRDRLCDCYLIKLSQEKKVEARPSLSLADLGKGKKVAPYHLVNTTINLTTSKNPELRGRNGDFFLISKHICGSPTSGYFPTDEVVKKNPHLDLGTAMAISGAAASTNMGWQTMGSYRFLMGLFNIRLGYWLLNPKPEHKVRCPRLEGAGPGYLFKEVLGKMNENDRYLNLSDGGHIENLAVYELLRRRCKFIVCVDGGMEAGMECADLIRLHRYVEIDLGIRMEYDLSDLYLNERKHSKAYALLVKIKYPLPAATSNEPNETNMEVTMEDEKGEQEQNLPFDLGWMLYIKLAVTGAEPAYVLDYRRQNPSFPHQTTGDQFFDEEQFEAYRMLGECAAESLFRDEILSVTDKDMQKKDWLWNWFQNLANNLLPDNDEVFGMQDGN